MRDYVADMENWLLQAQRRLPPNASIMAHHIVGELRRQDPDLLDGWLRLQAEDALRRRLQSMVSPRRRRSIPLAVHPEAKAARSFLEAGRAAAAGNSEQLQEYYLNRTYRINGTTIKLADMTAEHLRVASQDFARSADRALMEVAFLKALAARCEREQATVGDLYDETTLQSMWTSLSTTPFQSSRP